MCFFPLKEDAKNTERNSLEFCPKNPHEILYFFSPFRLQHKIKATAKNQFPCTVLYCSISLALKGFCLLLGFPSWARELW